MEPEHAFPPTPLQGRYLRVSPSNSILPPSAAEVKTKNLQLLHSVWTCHRP
ncbi:Hypothetical Protein OBI_RACECAR_311 [Arthrobacter phage Racecar]|nr:hypothetical protein PBI_RACECAR_103 [Arthrobacter phage Racecar]